MPQAWLVLSSVMPCHPCVRQEWARHLYHLLPAVVGFLSQFLCFSVVYRHNRAASLAPSPEISSNSSCVCITFHLGQLQGELWAISSGCSCFKHTQMFAHSSDEKRSHSLLSSTLQPPQKSPPCSGKAHWNVRSGPHLKNLLLSPLPLREAWVWFRLKWLWWN